MEGKDKFKKGDLVRHYRKRGIILEVGKNKRNQLEGIAILWTNGQTSTIFFDQIPWCEVWVLARA